MNEGSDFFAATRYQTGITTKYGPLPDAPLGQIDLPRVRETAAEAAGLARLLEARRSRRKLSGPISREQLSFLLWASDGISGSTASVQLRTAPSAGARYAIDTYLLALNVDGIEGGLYRYRPEGHAVDHLRQGDLRDAAVKACAGQEWVRGAAAVFVWVAEFARTTAKYKERGYRYVLLDAGHICQNLYLAAEAEHLGMTAIAAYSDDEANALLGRHYRKGYELPKVEPPAAG